MINIKALNATLSSGEVILDEISFKLPKGAKLAIIGANGSGKSTLMQAMLGMIPVRYESYQLGQEDFTALTPVARAKMISYIGQQIVPENEITAWEWCELSRYPHGSSRAENQQIITAMLEKMNALHFAPRRLSSLSGGERQRIYMAGALTQETPMIFLDEVSAALDPKYREAMHQTIGALSDKTVVAITHDLNALHFYSHILALKAGKIVAFGPRETVLTQSLLQTVFDYEFTEVWHEGHARYF